MSVNVTTEASLDFATLQARIYQQEQHGVVRLTSLAGKWVNGVTFNAHVYKSVEDHRQPYSKLFVNTGFSDPAIMAWLSSHLGQHIVCESNIYINGALTKIVVVR